MIETIDFIPLNDRVVVRRAKPQEITASGIIIPNSVQDKEKPAEGVVVAVGKGLVTDNGNILPLDVKVGDYILFNKNAGQDIEIDGTTFLILVEDSIIGILNKA